MLPRVLECCDDASADVREFACYALEAFVENLGVSRGAMAGELTGDMGWSVCRTCKADGQGTRCRNTYRS